MHSSLYGKIAKAKQYAQEPERLKIRGLEASFDGDNTENTVALKDGAWHCTCNFFHEWGACAHTMATERILGHLIPDDLRQGEPLAESGYPLLPQR
jgi:hypothetical protein